MCGIVGILQLDGSVPDPVVLDRMVGAIEHRGPDDRGIFLDGSLALGFRRLSIIDVACGHQPLTTAEGQHTIVFNGEIYNYADIRKVLEQEHGRSFTTHSDTEVIANAVAVWGEGALPRLNGMFAFAVWDRNAQRLLLARDRLGKKPLHFVKTRDAFVFSSEIKSLMQHPDVKALVNSKNLPTFLTYRYVPGNETLFQGVEVLQPACVMSVSPVEMTNPRRWWDYEFPGESARQSVDANGVREELRNLLTDAVRLRMISEVPLGAFLSGGIDSSLIVALMSQLHPAPVKTFSIGFDSGFNEAENARAVAERFNTDHHEIIVGSDDLIRAIPAALYARESPISEPSDIPIYLLSKLARSKVTVVLSGEGSDEIFAGYPKYVFEHRYGRLLRALPSKALRQLGRQLPSRLRGPQLALDCISQQNKFESYACWFGAFNREQLCELFIEKAPGSLATEEHGFSSRVLVGREMDSRINEMMYLDTRHWLPANLLLRGDRMTMANSLELRCPFLDYRLVEFAAGRIPLSLKIRGGSGKWILKQLAQQLLPPEIIHRPKWGFKVPVAEWFRGPLRRVLEETLLSQTCLGRGYFAEPVLRRLIDEHTSGRANHDKKLWILFQLELWQRMFIDGTLSPTDALI
ncbi:MAG: asparagine synthase (glutamine-hydrolyzing) [Candidatus Sumerlaeaceae bacterium]